METKNLTYEDLGRFTEETLLPAIEKIFDYKLEEKLESKLEEKLGPIRQRLDAIEEKIDAIKIELDGLDRRTNEDTTAVFGDVKSLRERIEKLELEVKKMKTA